MNAIEWYVQGAKGSGSKSKEGGRDMHEFKGNETTSLTTVNDDPIPKL